MLYRILFFSAYILCISACRKAGDSTVQKSLSDTARLDTEKEVVMEEGSPEKNAYAEFSALKGDVIVRVRDWRKDVPMDKLGNLKDTTVQILGHGADTHMGASIHTYTYEDMQLQFYGPKNGTDNWIVNIELTGKDWSTARGIHVGDSVKDLNTLYPKASNELTGDKNLYRYELEESTIEFSVANDIVSKIVIRYNIP